jgi:integrase
VTSSNRESGRTRIGLRVVIYRRGRKQTFTADFHFNGKHNRKSLKTTNKREAIRRAVNLEQKLETGNYANEVAVHKQNPSMTISHAVSMFINFGMTEGLRPKSIVKQRGILQRFTEFSKSQGSVLLTQVDLLLLDTYRSMRKPQLSDKSMCHEGQLLKQFLGWCCERQLIRHNPLEHSKFSPPKYAPRGGPSLQQINAILAAASPHRRPILATLAMTGLRSGEVAHLRVEDVDLGKGWIHVVSRRGFETKTGDSWKVPIHPRLRATLEEARPHGPGWFFRALPSKKYPNGDHTLSTKHLNEDLLRILKRLGMPAGREGGFTIHSLRHSFKAICVNARVPREVVDVWQNHAPDRSASHAYYKLSDEESQRFMVTVPF